jgi:hypothetical protein
VGGRCVCWADGGGRAGGGGRLASGRCRGLHFVEPVAGVHLLHQRPDLGILRDGHQKQASSLRASQGLHQAMINGFYRRLVALVQIGEIADELVELELLRVVRVVPFEDRLDLGPIRRIRMPQVQRLFDLRGVDAVLLVTACCLQQPSVGSTGSVIHCRDSL